MVTKPSKVQDLDMDAIVSTERHDKDFANLDKRIADLEEKFGSNEKIADTLCEAATKAAKMQDLFENNFLKLLSRNDPVRDEIKCLIKLTDRDFVQAKLKQYGTWIAAVGLFLAAQGSIELIKWLFRLLGSPTGISH